MAERIQMTALSPTMEEGSIVSWNKKEGDTVVSGDVLCEVETDKATMDYESTQEGVLLKIVLAEGESAVVGQTIGIIGEAGEDFADLMHQAAAGKGQRGAQRSPEPTAAKPAQRDESGMVRASPLARKMAQSRGIDLSLLEGSGPDGRVVKRDIEGFSADERTTQPQLVSTQPRQDRTIAVSRQRAVIARRLSESKFEAPHYYVKDSVNMEAVIAARAALNRQLPEKAGFNAFIVKFAAEALKRQPQINASWQGSSIIQFGSIDIGLAVDAGNGLITPIIRNCADRGVIDIDAELKRLIEKARNNALTPEEYSGATFTISNLGSFGVEEFTAIINPPGAAILAVGETRATPVVDESGEVVVKPIMKLTLSSDHRVIDGAAAAGFINELKLMMENPARVLF